MRWRVYYGDDSTFSDRDGTPFDAPPPDAQVIAVEDPEAARGFKLIHKRPYYCFRDGEWYQLDEAGYWDYMMLHRGPKIVLFGRTMRTPHYWAVLRRAKQEGLG